MNLELSHEQRLLVGTVKNFIAEELRPLEPIVEESGELSAGGLTAWAGAGIVTGSDPYAEHAETAAKMTTVLSAFQAPHQASTGTTADKDMDSHSDSRSDSDSDSDTGTGTGTEAGTHSCALPGTVTLRGRASAPAAAAWADRPPADGTDWC